jgi:hypothetical protein
MKKSVFQRGLITTTDGHYYLLHPVLSRHRAKLDLDGKHAHVIHKRGAKFSVLAAHNREEEELTVKPCLFGEPKTCFHKYWLHRILCSLDANDDPYPEDNQFGNIYSLNSERLAVTDGQPFTIELGVFADDAMWTHFREIYGADADAEMQRFILATANNVR